MTEVIQKILNENSNRQLNLASTTCQWVLAQQIAEALSKAERQGAA